MGPGAHLGCILHLSTIALLYLRSHGRSSVPPLSGSAGGPLLADNLSSRGDTDSHQNLTSSARLSVHVPVEVGVVSVGTLPSIWFSLSLSFMSLSLSLSLFFSRLDVDDPYVPLVLLQFRHLSDGFVT